MVTVLLMPRVRRDDVERKDEVRFTFDGEEIVAVRGEPLASAIIAAGSLSIARSPKFHRPRGPACFRSACDGCLARVNGSPNVMTCMAAAEGGEVVESQNTLGPRNMDLLRLTDWFFPEGFNHHELFAGVVGVQKVMQVFARRIAGIGKLPNEPAPPRAAKRIEVDALVVGGGPSGLAIASRLTEAGRSVWLVDDGVGFGGSAGALPGRTFEAVLSRFATIRDRVRVHLRSTIIGAFGDDLLLVTPEETLVLHARDVVVATGAHDGVLAFEGNDLPGIMSARAACVMLRWGVVPGSRIIVVVAEGGGPFGEAYARALKGKDAVDVRVVKGEPTKASGTSRVKSVTLASGATHQCDAVLIDAPRAPSYELCEQLGAKVAHEPRGFVVVAENGRIREGVWAVGEVTNVPLSFAAIEADADKVFAAMNMP